MKYYVIEIAQGDSKIAGKSIYEYDDRNTAIGNYHSKLGTAMKSDLYTSDFVQVIAVDTTTKFYEFIESENYIKGIE